MKLDVGTLFLLGTPLALVCCLLQLASWLRWRNPASLWWAAADGIGGAGVVLLLSHQWFAPWIARSLAQTIIFGSGLVMWQGFRRFSGQPPLLRTFAAAALVYFSLFETLRSQVDDLAALIVLASFAHGLQRAGLAFDLARATFADGTRLRALLVTMFAMHALFYLFRAVTAVTVEAGATFLRTDGLQNATLVLGLLTVALWNGASLRLAGRRHRAFEGAEAQA
jgi:hypothetical protein